MTHVSECIAVADYLKLSREKSSRPLKLAFLD